MLHSAAERFEERPYVWGKHEAGWSARSFREVEKDSAAFASALIKKGYSKGNCIAILSEGSPRWVIGEYGILRSGCISVPLSIKLLPEEILFRLQHSEAKAILVSKNTIPKLTSIYKDLAGKLDVIYLDEEREYLGELIENSDIEKERTFLFEDMLSEERSLGIAASSLKEIEEQIKEDDVVTISYTSGTTGNPKGIMLTHLNYYTNCRDAIEMFEVPPDFRTLLILPCDHSFAHTVGLYSALIPGISLYFVDARGGGMAILRNIPINLKEANPDFLLTVPSLTGNFMKKIKNGIEEKGELLAALFSAGINAGITIHGNGFDKTPLWKKLINAAPYKIVDILIFRKVRAMFGNRIRFCVGGGALLDIKQQEFFKALGVPIYQGYGLTEAAPIISSNMPKLHKLGTSGQIAPSVECRIVDSDGAELPPGEIGEITVRGDNVMKGYYKNQEATRETIVDGWLHTGDRGYMDRDGFLSVVGREKALLIASDGEKYSPEEIEEAIINCSDFISQVMIYNDHKKYTSALAVLEGEKVARYIRENGITSAEELLPAIQDSFYSFKNDPVYRNRFPSMWIPATFVILREPFSEENKMINSTMKMVRYKIVEAYQELLDYMYTPKGDSCANPKNLAVVNDLFDFKR
jgi:long-chain acyl-CoA synthetase